METELQKYLPIEIIKYIIIPYTKFECATEDCWGSTEGRLLCDTCRMRYHKAQQERNKEMCGRRVRKRVIRKRVVPRRFIRPHPPRKRIVWSRRVRKMI